MRLTDNEIAEILDKNPIPYEFKLIPMSQNCRTSITDMDLLDFMVRQYQTQSKLAEALKLGDSAISSWRKTGQLPKAWKMYFMAQFEKGAQNV